MSGGTPAADGFRMPAEWTPHERTIMAWPCRRELWEDLLDRAKEEYEAAVRAVARFEPVLLCANLEDADEVRSRFEGEENVEVYDLPLDDSWMRDNGPIGVLREDGSRAAVHFRFNAWGKRFHPYDRDASAAVPILAHLGIPRFEAHFVLEGGAITVDGEGTLVTTEQCLLNPNRNPELSREEIEQGLRDHLGVDRIVWLGRGLVEDRDTDGHVDLICAFTRPGQVLLQTTTDPDNPNRPHMEENRRRLEGAGIEVLELPWLPYEELGGQKLAVTSMNFSLVNGGVVVPVCGSPDDDEILARIGEAYPGREVVPVPGTVLAAGGGGVHCITQQVPAGV